MYKCMLYFSTSELFTEWKWVLNYVARVRFGTRVQVRDSVVFEKIGCWCGGTQRLKNY